MPKRTAPDYDIQRSQRCQRYWRQCLWRAGQSQSPIQQGHSSLHTGLVPLLCGNFHPSAHPGTYKLICVSAWSSTYGVRGFPKGHLLRLGHYSCSFKTLIKPQAGLGLVLIPTFPPLLLWRSPFTCTSAGWKGATSHLPSLSRGSVTNEHSLALFFHPHWPVLLQEETFQGSD